MTRTPLLALLPAFTLLTVAPAASAQEVHAEAAAGVEAHPGGAETRAKAEGEAGEERGKEGEGEGEEEAKGLELGVDAVFGFGDVPAVNQGPLTTLGEAPPNKLESTQVQSDSYVFGAGYWLTDHFRLGARIPLVHGTLKPAGIDNTRGVTAMGNIEVGAEYELELSKSLRLVPGLGIALPTATGDELPEFEEVRAEPNARLDTAAHDRFSALQAASASRGFEDSALFESKRLGIIPELALELHAGKIELVPFVKMENLVSTASNPAHKYLGEVVGGARFSYRVASWLDVGLRAWMVGAFEKEEKPGNVNAVVEPQLRAHLGAVMPVVGLLIPVVPATVSDSTPDAAPIFDPRFIALRVGAGARF